MDKNVWQSKQFQQDKSVIPPYLQKKMPHKLIFLYTFNNNNVVLYPFTGSGTTCFFSNKKESRLYLVMILLLNM